MPVQVFNEGPVMFVVSLENIVSFWRYSILIFQTIVPTLKFVIYDDYDDKTQGTYGAFLNISSELQIIWS